MKYVIGIDVGSGSARAGIFSLNGEEKGFSSTNIKIKKYEENVSSSNYGCTGADRFCAIAGL